MGFYGGPCGVRNRPDIDGINGDQFDSENPTTVGNALCGVPRICGTGQSPFPTGDLSDSHCQSRTILNRKALIDTNLQGSLPDPRGSWDTGIDSPAFPEFAVGNSPVATGTLRRRRIGIRGNKVWFRGADESGDFTIVVGAHNGVTIAHAEHFRTAGKRLLRSPLVDGYDNRRRVVDMDEIEPTLTRHASGSPARSLSI